MISYDLSRTRTIYSMRLFFNKISDEFDPITELPADFCEDSWTLEAHEVFKMLKESKKPQSQVRGDVFPDLIDSNCDILALPLTFIYNLIIQTGSWPTGWKEETVVIIPKTKSPDSLSQCRNLSCTPFFSKTFERFVFTRLTSEISLSSSQYGGRKDMGVNHMLVDMFDTILTDLDCGGGSASCLISLDFEKAFNRLEHDACIEALSNHGASKLSIRIVHAFLKGRTMSARIGSTLSSKKAVNGGSPQGSILGNLLFIVTTDKLSDGIEFSPGEVNEPRIDHGESDDLDGSFMVLDGSLARIISDSPSELGINNITVMREDEERTVSFNDNGIDNSNGLIEQSYFQHGTYTQSTPTNRGQFHEFVPPGNLVNACLSGEFSSTTGMTFVYMQNVKKGAIITESTDNLIKSALALSLSNQAIDSGADDPHQWASRDPIVPFTYIDDSNGSERLNLKNGTVQYSEEKQKVIMHAKNRETFFNSYKERSAKLGMKINPTKTQLLCISPAGKNNEAFIGIDGEKSSQQIP